MVDIRTPTPPISSEVMDDLLQGVSLVPDAPGRLGIRIDIMWLNLPKQLIERIGDAWPRMGFEVRTDGPLVDAIFATTVYKPDDRHADYQDGEMAIGARHYLSVLERNDRELVLNWKYSQIIGGRSIGVLSSSDVDRLVERCIDVGNQAEQPRFDVPPSSPERQRG